jgi:hypothetical protein
MTTRGFDGRMDKLERRAGPAPDPDQERKARVVDDWLELVTGKAIDAMSGAELSRLEQMFRGDDPIGDDASDLVLACMDSEQHVVDLEQRRQQLDRWPFR